MAERTQTVLIVGLLLTTLAVATLGTVMQFRMNARSGPISEPVTLEGTVKMAPDHSTSWTSSRGTETVNTTCGSPGHEGETEQECADRHDAKVAARQRQWPQV